MRRTVGQAAHREPPLVHLSESICVTGWDIGLKVSRYRLEVASIPGRIGRGIGFSLVPNTHRPKTNLILRFTEPLMRLHDVAASPCEGRKYGGCRFESILANDRRQVGLSAGRRHGPVELGHLGKRDVDGLLSREKAFSHFHGGVPACFEHNISLRGTQPRGYEFDPVGAGCDQAGRL